MKNLKKLIPALCLLLISAMLLGTSTFAWFTMNTTVTASNLLVKATTGGNLLIALPTIDAETKEAKAPAVSDFQTSANFAMSKSLEIPPVSTVDLDKWYKTTAGAVSNTKKATEATYVEATAKVDYLKETFYLYAGMDMDLYTSAITATVPDGENTKSVLLDGNNPLWNSLRIGIKVGDSFCIYALTAATADGSHTNVATGEDATAIGVGTTESGTGEVLINKDENTKIFHAIVGDGADADKIKLCSLKQNEITEATVFIWFEGTDGACYTNNYKDSNVTIGFTLSQLPAAAPADEEPVTT